MLLLPPLITILTTFIPTHTHAAIHQYKNVVLPRDVLMFRKSGMYGPHDTPEGEGEESFIKVDLTFQRSVPEYHGEPVKIQLAVFDEQAWQHLGTDGVAEDGSTTRVYCCTKALIKEGVCDEELALILREDVDKATYVQDVEFPVSPDDSTKTGSVRVQRKFSIPNKGMKYVLFASCNDLTGQIVINGATEWKNPYGYLPGELHGLLSFFAIMAVAYMIVAILWSLASVRVWRELMMLQTFATGALTLGMIEMGIRYFDFATFNAEGTRETGLLVMSSLSHTTKQTTSRVLVLIVAMGYGVVKPSLEPHTKRNIFCLGGLFFVCAAVQRLYDLLSHTSALNLTGYITLVPITMMDLSFGIWIFFSLQQVITFLIEKEANTIKLSLYTRFRWVLGLTMLIAFMMSLTYGIAVLSGKVNAEWETRWFYDASFDVLYFTTLLAILFLFRPVDYASDYAYRPVNVKTANGGNSSNSKAVAAADEEYGHELQEETELITKQ